MVYIETESMNPCVNLAFEEYLLTNDIVADDIVMLWQNAPTVVVGAFQNTLEEVDAAYAREQGIKIVRRISGGGAVYHDLGNICFSFIMKRENFANTSYSVFLQPVVAALNALNIKAESSGRNDMTIDGRKISGCALRLNKNKVLFHGTLLYATDLDVLSRILLPPDDKIQSKAIKSVRSRVVNISEFMDTSVSVTDFKQRFLYKLFHEQEAARVILSQVHMNNIQKLAETKYASYDWTFGSNPKAELTRSKRFECGKVDVSLTVRHHKIEYVKISGDFLGCSDISIVENALVGVPYEEAALYDALKDIDMNLHLGNISKKEFIALISV